MFIFHLMDFGFTEEKLIDWAKVLDFFSSIFEHWKFTSAGNENKATEAFTRQRNYRRWHHMWKCWEVLLLLTWIYICMLIRLGKGSFRKWMSFSRIFLLLLNHILMEMLFICEWFMFLFLKRRLFVETATHMILRALSSSFTVIWNFVFHGRVFSATNSKDYHGF